MIHCVRPPIDANAKEWTTITRIKNATLQKAKGRNRRGRQGAQAAHKKKSSSSTDIT
jgi:hypothetical protein